MVLELGYLLVLVLESLLVYLLASELELVEVLLIYSYTYLHK
jgi:hypothetical protein